MHIRQSTFITSTFKSGRKINNELASIAYGKKQPLVILPVKLINGPNYSKHVVRLILNPVYIKLEKEIGWAIFKEDGAPSDRAKYSPHIKKWLRIQTMSWLPQSHDLNPINNPWCIRMARIKKRESLVTTKDVLNIALQEECDLFTSADLDCVLSLLFYDFLLF